MKTKQTLLVAGALSAMVVSTPPAETADLRPLVVANLAGTLHLVQGVPCDRVVDLTTSVREGRLQMTPAVGLDTGDGNKIFNLANLTVFFMPITVEGECRGVRDRHNVTEIGIRLASAVSVRAVAAGDGYRVTIPKERFLIYDAILDNRVAKAAYERPSEDVTGTIDLTRGTVQLHLVVPTRLRFRAGCTTAGRCLIDEIRNGIRTADIAGTIVRSRSRTPPRRR